MSAAGEPVGKDAKRAKRSTKSSGKGKGRAEKRPKVPAPVGASSEVEGEYSLDGLEARLARLSTYVNRRVSLIPAEHYLSKTAEEEVEQVGKFAYNKKQKAPKQEIKDASKKAKRLRLDPDSAPASVPDLQAAQADLNGTDPDGDAGEAALVDDMDDMAGSHVGETVPRNVLHERLTARISQLRGKRKAKEELARDGPNNGAKKNKKQKAKQLAEELAKKKSIAGAVGRDGASAPMKDAAAATNGDGSVVFSKFDFSTAERVNEKKKKGSATPMQKLAKAKSDRERLLKLKSEDPEKAKEVETKNKWKTALLKATGTKIQDNEKLLKRTIKRKETAKKKTEKDWAERIDVKKKYHDEKQKKRKENLKARATSKVEKRMNRGKKAKKVIKKRPGFEGGATPPKKPKERMTLQTGYKQKK